MNLSEDELRAMIRAAVARQTGAPAQAAPRGERMGGAPAVDGAHAAGARFAHASHGLIFTASGGGDDEGRCLIEPTVACTHCGYCQSLGH